MSSVVKGPRDDGASVISVDNPIGELPNRLDLVLQAFEYNDDVELANLVEHWIDLKFGKFLHVEDIPMKDLEDHSPNDSLAHDFHPNNLDRKMSSGDEEDKEAEEVKQGKYDRKGNMSVPTKVKTKFGDKFKDKRGKKTFNYDVDKRDDPYTQLPKILRTFKAKLNSFIESRQHATMKRSDFERMGGMPDPFDRPESMPEGQEYDIEGRKSYLKIRTKKNWPPTMDDLLEYI